MGTEGRFEIKVTPGRRQPYAVWRMDRVWQFFETEDEALKFIRATLDRERYTNTPIGG